MRLNKDSRAQEDRYNTVFFSILNTVLKSIYVNKGVLKVARQSMLFY